MFVVAVCGTGNGPLIGRLAVTSARLKLRGITTHSLWHSRWTKKAKVEGCPMVTHVSLRHIKVDPWSPVPIGDLFYSI